MRTMILGKSERQIVLGVPVLFLAGTALHFVYGLSGGLLPVGLFAPVNESVWEHLKLAAWPMAVWWLGGFLWMRRRWEVDAPAWFAGALGAVAAALSAVTLLFYFYTGAFGVELPGVDILIFFLAVLLGQGAGLRLYQRGSGVSWVVPLAVLAAVLLLFMVFTVAPPNLPLFTDPVTGLRGVRS